MSLKTILLGKARSLEDQDLFHKVSLIAVFAWVGLGADGLSSSCYGPEETFKVLGSHPHLAIFVALASVLTILVICASYAQIISLFPSGGGGYLVASKLLSPAAGVVSGSALLVDYVLTITVSVANSADALFSLGPTHWQSWKLATAFLGVIGLTLLNLRGVKESVMLWVPIFFLFVVVHAIGITYALGCNLTVLPEIARETVHEVHGVTHEVGVFGLLALLLKAYSMGAGSYTGIEAVSNGLPILREPRVRTGRKTMAYMGISLAVTVAGLLLAYLLFHVAPVEGKTLNAVLFDHMTATWPSSLGKSFVWLALASEAALLLIAAQAGFLDGPRVLANMALDRWLPSRFANLSDRFVTQNGVVLMGAAALAMLVITRGSVELLIILYSINVFVTFSLSQLGMVRHWLQVRMHEPRWLGKLAVNGLGLVMTLSILASLVAVKFADGGWITVFITSALVVAAFAIKRHYRHVGEQLHRLDLLLKAAHESTPEPPRLAASLDPRARTAVILVNGYNGLGLHTLLNVPRVFGDSFRNFVFLQIGVVDAGNFKGADEIEALRAHVEADAQRYVHFAHSRGFGAEAITAVGTDTVGEILKLAEQVHVRFSNLVFFAGQLLFERETALNRFLHNHTVFLLQRRFYLASLPFVILPIRVQG